MDKSISVPGYAYALPLTLLIFHQHLSNSAFGFNNPVYSLLIFLIFIGSLCYFLLSYDGTKLSNVLVVVLVIFFIAIWVALGGIFKDIANLYLNIFLTFYLLKLRGFEFVRKQLAFLVAVSLLLSVFQIAGTSEMVHHFNSHFIAEVPGGFIKKVEINNIMNQEYGDYFTFDSRQVRAPGIFHSSALISGVFTMYMAFVFCGYLRTWYSYALIPVICIFSGSKLVLLAAILMLVMALIFRKLSWRAFFTIGISAYLTVVVHKALFYSLLDFQFNIDILLFSLEIRFEQYDWNQIDILSFLPSTGTILLAILSLLMVKKLFGIKVNSDQLYYYGILFIAISSSFFTTPHIGNFLFGWFYFPALFVYKLANEDSSTTANRRSLLPFV